MSKKSFKIGDKVRVLQYDNSGILSECIFSTVISITIPKGPYNILYKLDGVVTEKLSCYLRHCTKEEILKYFN